MKTCLIKIEIIIFFLICVFNSVMGVDMLSQLYRGSDNISVRHVKVIGIPLSQHASVAELKGPAIINHIWITVKSPIPQIQAMIVLRVWWDDEEMPSIEVPLGDFFAAGFGEERQIKSFPIEMKPVGVGVEEHSALNCYWKMPFAKKARFEVENKSNRSVSMFFIQIDYEKVDNFEEAPLYFHAQYRRENPVGLHIPYTILEAHGSGNYAGTIMNYHLLEKGAWVEGAQEFYIDGDTSPTIPGTGSEDYFGQAWGFKFEDNNLFHGTSFGPKDNKMTAYRFHIPDPVRFKKSIKATIRCHGWDVGDRQDDYSSVALWYQNEPHDKFPKMPEIDYDYINLEEKYRKNPLEILNEKRKKIKMEGENLSSEISDYRESGHFDIDGKGSMAFDRDIGTKWCEIENPDAHWLAADLGQICEVTGFIILNPSATGDSPGFDMLGFRIESSDSFSSEWKKIAEADFSAGKNIQQPDNFTLISEPGEKDIIAINLKDKITTRYIRLYIYKSCALDKIARVQEFEIWGKRVK